MKRLAFSLAVLPVLSAALTACNANCEGSICRTERTFVVKEGRGGQSVEGVTVAVARVTGDSAVVTANGVPATLKKGQRITVHGTSTRVTLRETRPGEHQVTLKIES